MLPSAKVQEVIEVLDRTFPDPRPPLKFSSAFELLVAVVLSAQCTDERVNQTTPTLFTLANTPEAIIRVGFEKLRELIHSCGYHNQKAKSLLACAEALLEKHGGEVPHTLEELTALPGIGRKSASVILAQAFGVPAFPVDTHVFRVSNRIGIVKEKNPEKTADALERRVPRDQWIPFHLQLIFHGRKTCKAPRPRCWECPIRALCAYPHKTISDHASKKRSIHRST